MTWQEATQDPAFVLHLRASFSLSLSLFAHPVFHPFAMLRMTLFQRITTLLHRKRPKGLKTTLKKEKDLLMIQQIFLLNHLLVLSHVQLRL